MIAIVCSTVYELSETFITRHIHELAPGRVTVICLNSSNTDKLPCPYYLVNNESAGWMGCLQGPVKAWNLARYGFARALNQKKIKEISEFLQAHRVRVILAEYGNLGCMILPVAAKLGLPCVVYFRGIDASRLLNLRFIRYSYRRLLPRAAGIICVSRFLENNLKMAGFTHPNTHIIPSGVDIKKFVPGDKDRNLVLGVGRFTDKKAPDQTIRAFAKVAAGHKKVHLEMIGDGPLLSQCKALAQDLGISGRVTFHGAKGHAFVRDRLSVASIFVQHSVTAKTGDAEGLPGSIQEAMSSGLAVVSTRHSGIPEAVVDGQTGLLVDEHDVEGMSRSLDRLLDSPDLAAEMGRKGRERAVQYFSADISLSRIRHVLGL